MVRIEIVVCSIIFNEYARVLIQYYLGYVINMPGLRPHVICGIRFYYEDVRGSAPM